MLEYTQNRCMNFRLQPEYAQVSVHSEPRPKRLSFPRFFAIGKWSKRWRDFASSNSYSDVLSGNHHTRQRSARAARQEPEPLNDQTFSTFLKNLHITLPSWHPKTLDEELRQYYEHEEKKKHERHT